ncbi:MAG: MCP four helix bundle domain-containing protein [Bdellovibrio sp.]|nr:MCP four helix bundle domain-containing protein [Bdellovibrio sp.]
MLKKIGIKARLILGFAVTPVILLVLITLGIYRVNSINQSLTTINDINAVKQRYAINFRGSVHDRAISLRDVVLSASAEESQKSVEEINKLASFYADSSGPLEKIFAEQAVSAEEVKLLKDIKEIEKETLPLINQVVDLQKSGDSSQAKDVLMNSAKPAFITWLARINKFIDYQEAANSVESKVARGLAKGFQDLMLILTAFGILASVIITYLVMKSIVPALSAAATGLDKSSESISSISQSIYNSSQLLSEGATKQASSIEEISASIEELTSMTKMNASSADSGKAAANQARALAEAGAEEMIQMQKAMDAIQQSSNEISAIINTIDNIAFQTNLLALNASVEAARAGDQGKGFAVVANEVRGLAQRSADAAKETSQKIENALERSAQGVELSKKVMEGFKQILEKSRNVDTIVGEVAQASKEQSTGFIQITSAISEMDRITQNNAKLAAETAQTLEVLNEQSTEVRAASSNLLKIVG